MHRSPHKVLTGLFALLLLVVASQALADGPRGHGSRHYGSGNHGSHAGYNRYSFSHHGSYSNYSYNNYWYRPYGPRYVVVAPPFGFGVSVLPPYYSTLWYGGSPYYYADSTYYSWRPERREYVVTEKPRGEPETRVETGGSEEIFVYPRDGQTEEQQSTDRYECHRWAVDKTGFDPTRPSGNVGGTEITTKRVDYRRAESACLEGRGYTVR
ncbi:MAG TPA: hypothetical protein VIV63_02445 [Steroidobacteraceae bacterium]